VTVCAPGGFNWRVALAAALVVVCASCRRSPTAPTKAAYDPTAAGEQAIEMFDKNGDELLDDDELRRCPGLAEGKSRADANGDGRLSAQEIAARVQYWLDSRRRVVAAFFEFTMRGQPLAGVDVVLEPESFLAQWIPNARATTNRFGQASPANPGISGAVQMGYYRVKISDQSGGKRRIPERYDEETELGVEITDDRPEEDRTIRFDLRSR